MKRAKFQGYVIRYPRKGCTAPDEEHFCGEVGKIRYLAERNGKETLQWIADYTQWDERKPCGEWTVKGFCVTFNTIYIEFSSAKIVHFCKLPNFF